MKQFILMIFLLTTTLVQAQETNYETLISEGKSYVATQDYEAAIASFEQAIKLDSTKVEGFYALGVTYGFMYQKDNQESDFQTALKYYDKAQSMEPDYANIHFNYALLYTQNKNYELALIHINKQLELHPNDVDSIYTKGQILGYLDNVDEACKCLKKAAKMGEPRAKKLYKKNC